ncbi:30S ribosome-binding factor RbfA [Acetomicrobium sp. S15 = DSM 107314]|jgi:ribosome-binding factor A|uniref:30S ribosome-binding factor RbfA n=1 Tax=Acetomicrobium sp. S15 = DSM 107314 TaxID=2529858 RepID=UPI0018E0CB93|nr:30S ribosome-binding factor RbfA [Acetomicrobium sp. S15 = DSM 107314]
MTSFHIERINKELAKEISLFIQRRIKDENVKKAVILGVECSKDMSRAKVYFTTLDRDDREKVTLALEKSSGLMRSVLSKEMHVRSMPAFCFIFDESEDRARRMEALLDRISGKDENGG